MGIRYCVSGIGIQTDYPLQAQRFEAKFQELVHLFRESRLDLLQEVVCFVYNFIYRGFAYMV